MDSSILPNKVKIITTLILHIVCLAKARLIDRMVLVAGTPTLQGSCLVADQGTRAEGNGKVFYHIFSSNELPHQSYLRNKGLISS